ncbi:MAG: sigma-54-dependent Fis family transcriptional regulator [Deltaproteobacteria bacterium]|nr:sigma-54-dependent Fis family transcriptional regulator [Deltaproteobacteria bacterium]MBW2661348.1 sigma-54-dependent Fis family transcriptional regulator [Deltaproteobacteria bacterium]
MKTKTILIVDDEPSMRIALSESLKSCGYKVEVSGSGVNALEKFQEDKFEVVITDMRMPGMNGMDVLRGIKKVSSKTPVIVITAYGTINTAVEAMKEGASDFLMKPFSIDHLELLVKKVVAEKEEKEKCDSKYNVRKCLSREKTIITENKKMLALLELLKNVSRSKSSILIQGESGTGKELIARYIHLHSSRADMSFVAVNCAAIPHDLLESEMFGHEKGAFTGASRMRLGKFELANGGTLLLDEISEMDVQLQAKLLRVIQESEVDRLGSKASVPIDVRIIATTNADLKKYIDDKKFRKDLYYRLNVIPVNIPPLRERKGDVLLLCGYFLEKYSRLGRTAMSALSKEAEQMLENYNWPGNVRELENVIERAVLLSGGKTILPEHLYLEKEGERYGQPEEVLLKSVASEDTTLKEMEKKLIFKTLEKAEGNRTRASEILGISVRTIRNKLNEYKQDAEG